MGSLSATWSLLNLTAQRMAGKCIRPEGYLVTLFLPAGCVTAKWRNVTLTLPCINFFGVNRCRTVIGYVTTYLGVISKFMRYASIKDIYCRTTVGVREWIINFIQLFHMDEVTYPCPNRNVGYVNFANERVPRGPSGKMFHLQNELFSVKQY